MSTQPLVLVADDEPRITKLVSIALVALVIVLAGAWYFLAGPGAGTTAAPNDINVNVELPSVAPASS